MYHFFVAPEQLSEREARITGPDVNHIVNVLRMKVGERLMISAGEDWEYLCEIRALSREAVELTVLEENADVRELPVEITLYQGLPKGDKLELIIQKAVELGVRRVVPVETRRCVAKLDKRKAEARVRRWQAIAESAAKQSGRRVIPEVALPLSFSEALKEAEGSELCMIPYEKAEGMEATRELISSVEPGDRVAVMIGPEGGFEESEIQEAQERGFTALTLGKRILRTETAGLVVLSLLMAETEGR
ncbi:16S rRNA (uracil1498-N3)-methyltransferase [Fusobacterium naviforme]|nr:16S rRNA (uracil(1498)-N(3))-methyltransferase [Fusobacterium naviforme]PSL09337.1 16S rRNA (uracil1498-N3)-methyltransferase [Fusobacterium naviforme]STO27974.1 Ribosomal RNA small subunit methyltransferase E [Fusobacterium naviforme]